MVLNDIVMYCLAVCSAIVTFFIVKAFIEELVASRKKKSQPKVDPIQEIWYGVDQLRGEVERLNRSVNRIECKLGNYRKGVRDHFNYDNKNLSAIEADINKILELLNQQPEKKKEDNSALWGALSGILSGVLSSALMKGLDGSNGSSKKTEEQTDENVCYAVRKKGSEEWLDQRFDSIEQIAHWLNENGFSADDYDIGKVKPNSEETQE